MYKRLTHSYEKADINKTMNKEKNNVPCTKLENISTCSKRLNQGHNK